MELYNKFVDYGDLRLVNCQKYPYAVTSVDNFLSGWGQAENASAKFINLCLSYEMAKKMAEYAERRGDQKRVAVQMVKDISPEFFSRFSKVQITVPSQMWGWTADWREEEARRRVRPYSAGAAAEAAQKIHGELEEFDKAESPFPDIERLQKIESIEGGFVYSAERGGWVKASEEAKALVVPGFVKEEFKAAVKALYKSRLNNDADKIKRLPNVQSCADRARALFESEGLSERMRAVGLDSKESVGAFLKECAFEVFDKFYGKESSEKLKRLYEDSLKGATRKARGRDESMER